MKIFYICGYWSKKTDLVLGARPDEYKQAYRYVWAVKHGSHKVDFYITTADGQKRWIRNTNFEIVRKRFGGFIQQRIVDNGWQEALLVHVPSKDAVEGAIAPRSLEMLTESMANTSLAGSVCDALRWNSRLGASHEGGERRRRELIPHLALVREVFGQPVVLIDDLLTRGGNMLASQEVLEAAGAHVVGAVTCGRTMYDRSIRAYGRQELELTEELDDFNPASVRR